MYVWPLDILKHRRGSADHLIALSAEINMVDKDDSSQKETKEECGWCKWMKAGGCSAEFTVR